MNKLVFKKSMEDGVTANQETDQQQNSLTEIYSHAINRENNFKTITTLYIFLNTGCSVKSIPLIYCAVNFYMNKLESKFHMFWKAEG